MLLFIVVSMLVLLGLVFCFSSVVVDMIWLDW